MLVVTFFYVIYDCAAFVVSAFLVLFSRLSSKRNIFYEPHVKKAKRARLQTKINTKHVCSLFSLFIASICVWRKRDRIFGNEFYKQTGHLQFLCNNRRFCKILKLNISLTNPIHHIEYLENLRIATSFFLTCLSC